MRRFLFLTLAVVFIILGVSGGSLHSAARLQSLLRRERTSIGPRRGCT